ncbi:MAG: LLM class flavin-dependent oxidoreductase [Myxococcales bacterium]|nr:LLM class flavin-dependent oxidoreductase [Myxococcales bacterium]
MTSTQPLRFGLWYAFRNPAAWRRPFPELYAEVFEQIRWAEDIGFDDVWLTEHHFCEDGHAPSILPLAAAIAALTSRIRIGTGVLLLPLHNPVRVAEDGATIDIISNGRFELGVGVGYRPQEFPPLGAELSERATRTDEGLEIIRRLWSGETLRFSGRHHQFENVKLEPMPVQNPPPIWVGGFSPASVRRAARWGDGYLGTADDGSLSALYREELDKAGKDRDSGRLAGGHFWMIASRDPEKTWAELAPHVLYQMQVYNQWLAEAGQALFPEMKDLDDLRATGLFKVLAPADVIREIEGYLAVCPLERYYSWTIPPGVPAAAMNPYLELFASEVIPHFR